MKTIIILQRRRLLFCLILFGILVLALVTSCNPNDGTPVPQDGGSSGNIATIAGVAGAFGDSGDGGPALQANLGYMNGIAVDRMGNIYFVDGAANVARKIEKSTGKISTIAGTFLGFNVVDLTPSKGDGGVATAAHLNVPLGIAVDSLGNVYIADAGNNSVRKIDALTGIITRLAGKPNQLSSQGEGGPAIDAGLANPYDVAVDLMFNVYIVDSQNHAIRKIDASTGKISTIAGSLGTSGYSGDGTLATSAKLKFPHAICFDNSGNLFIVDAGNNVVRRIDEYTGIITTVAGNGTAGYSGDGGQANAAKLSAPSRVAADEDGNIYIVDTGNNAVRKIAISTGVITTFAGTGHPGFSGDGGPANKAQLSVPEGIAVDGDNNVFITDTGNDVIREVKAK